MRGGSLGLSADGQGKHYACRHSKRSRRLTWRACSSRVRGSGVFCEQNHQYGHVSSCSCFFLSAALVRHAQRPLPCFLCFPLKATGFRLSLARDACDTLNDIPPFRFRRQNLWMSSFAIEFNPEVRVFSSSLKRKDKRRTPRSPPIRRPSLSAVRPPRGVAAFFRPGRPPGPTRRRLPILLPPLTAVHTACGSSSRLHWPGTV